MQNKSIWNTRSRFHLLLYTQKLITDATKNHQHLGLLGAGHLGVTTETTVFGIDATVFTKPPRRQPAFETMGATGATMHAGEGTTA